jgi:A/G-specific adenine glycosylase
LPPLASAAWIRQFRRKLLVWYQEHRRPLPWRATDDPYAIWVSEIMLQQTQVATVIDYYYRFLERFPDVESLATADEQEVLRYWAGLGYYRRARQMQAAAQQIVDLHSGKFPTSVEQLRALPGIGRYTAGAIASFAYGTSAPILEANTQRLFSRLLGLRDDPKLSSSQSILWSFAESIVPSSGPNIGSINQAAMELGSLICFPRQPSCDSCPVASLCAAYEAGAQAEIPTLSKRPEVSPLNHALVVLHDRRGKILLRQNPPGQWWQGLWDFPRVDMTSHPTPTHFDPTRPNTEEMRTLVSAALLEQLGLYCEPTDYLLTLRHGVTRFRITLICYNAEQFATAELSQQHQWEWCDLRGISKLPLTSTATKLHQWLAQPGG